MLNLTRQRFRDIYKNTPVLDDEEIFFNDPKSDIDLIRNYLPSKLWRLNHIYKIVDKFGVRMTFKMRDAQHRVYAASLKHPRVIILKSRQQGISTFWLVSFTDDGITLKDFAIGLMAQGLNEAETLLKRIKILWDCLDENIKKIFNVDVAKDNAKAFQFTNNSEIYVRTSFRSATLQRLHVSEMGKIANNSPDKAEEVATGTLQAIAVGNTVAIESTAEGDNMFKKMWEKAVTFAGNRTGKDFYPVFLSWLDDPDCNIEEDQEIEPRHAKYFEELEEECGRKLTRTQKNFWITQERELGEKIFQEYPATDLEAFRAIKVGTYYASDYLKYVIKRGRELLNLYDPNLPVQVAVDLGMDDTNVLTIFQWHRGEFKVIDEVYGNGEGIKYYTDILKSKNYYENIAAVHLPHDANVKEHTSGLHRYEVFEKELPDAIINVLPNESRADGIDKVRMALSHIWLDYNNCEYLKKCFLNYRKEFDEKLNSFKTTPLHDKFSNGGDSIRYMVVGVDKYCKLVDVITRRRNRELMEERNRRGVNLNEGEGMDI